MPPKHDTQVTSADAGPEILVREFGQAETSTPLLQARHPGPGEPWNCYF